MTQRELDDEPPRPLDAERITREFGFASIDEARKALEDMALVAASGNPSPGAGSRVEDSVPEEEHGSAGTVVLLDSEFVIRAFNDDGARLFGVRTSSVLGKPASTLFRATGGGQPFMLTRSADSRDTISPGQDLMGVRSDGSTFPVALISSSLVTDSGVRYMVQVRDADVLRRDRARRRGVLDRFRSLVEQVPAITFMGSLIEDRPEFYVSPQIEGMLGFSAEEWLGNPFLWFNQIHPDDRDRWNREFTAGCISGGPFRSEFRALARNGETVWIRGEGRVVRDAMGLPVLIQGIAFDITEAKNAENKIRVSLNEKVVLLKEVHHRVKNNLQVISSLLKLQSLKVRDPESLAMFRESQDRIRSLAVLHEKLYQSDNMASVDFTEYVKSISKLLMRSYSEAAGKIRLVLDVDHVQLGLDTAVPCGLILNELMTNSLKYAFPGEHRGELRVGLKKVEGGLELRVSDTGVGLPEDFDLARTRSLGMRLVHTLSGQLGGTPELSPQPGTSFRMVFQPKESTP